MGDLGCPELQPAEAGEWEEVPPDGTPLTSSPNPRFYELNRCRVRSYSNCYAAQTT